MEEVLNDFQLFRACGPLYPAFAIESLTSVLMGAFFCYLSLRIAVRADVKQPLTAIWRCAGDTLHPMVAAWWKEVKQWPEMNKRPLSDRIKLCYLLNVAMCLAQAAACFFTVFRWLHVNNVNGMRYLGYAFTCALMQAELVVLIAPYVPCYKLNMIAVMVFTHVWLLTGWIGSLQSGFLFEDSSWNSFVENYDASVLIVTDKGLLIGATATGLSIMMFIQMPMLLIMYMCNGGYKAHPDLPYNYTRLLFTVWLTWPAFPCWWLVSAEGLGLLADAKSNALGFGVLNCISKGSFTYVMLMIWTDHKKRWPRPPSAPKSKSQELGWLVKSLKSFDSQPPNPVKAEESIPQSLDDAEVKPTKSTKSNDW
ncbi:unnamed protein product [Effrenium voratum]|nr:unnamed protein product [Effrenium voratum]